jgi:hypothetical protein
MGARFELDVNGWYESRIMVGVRDRLNVASCIGALALAVMAITEISAIAFGNPSFAVSQAGEDGAFYVQIAHNMAAEYGITFDRIAPTTGVHWGWLFFLAGVFRLIPTDDPEILFRLAGAIYFSCLLVAGILVALRYPIAGVFLVGYLANRGHWDMETNLLLAIMAAAYLWPNAILGFLLVIARTDMVIFAIIVSLITRKWVLAGGGIVGFCWVAIMNMLVDGNPISISAQIKAGEGFNDLETIYRTVGHLALYYFPVLEVTVALAIVYVWRIRKCDILTAGFVASSLLLVVHIARDSFVVGWYLAPLLLSSLLCGCALLRQAMESAAIAGPMRPSLTTSSVM